jgi:hypothetical protein
MRFATKTLFSLMLIGSVSVLLFIGSDNYAAQGQATFIPTQSATTLGTETLFFVTTTNYGSTQTIWCVNVGGTTTCSTMTEPTRGEPTGIGAPSAFYILIVIMLVLGTVALLLDRRRTRTRLEGTPARSKKSVRQITCPKCGWKNNAENDFCGKCRTPLSDLTRVY